MKISKSYSFDAAHILPRHPGKCGWLHGHTYTIEVGIEARVKSDTQFVIDYGDVDVFMKPLIDKYDHKYLNDFVAYPSAENIATAVARFVIDQLHVSVDSLAAQVRAGVWRITRVVVAVSETPKTSALWDSCDPDDLARLVVADDAEWGPPAPGASTKFLMDYLARRESASLV